MKRKKKQIKFKKERVILSDVLPFEIPVTFSNRRFYDFLVANGIEMNDDSITWHKDDPILEAIIKLLFGFPKNTKVIKREIKLKGNLTTIPFNYKISHKEKDYRELTIIHPKNQLAVIQFYEKYKELIIYYCSINPFSIRKPHRVAKSTYYNDKMHLENLAFDHEHKSVEELDKEYKNLKTYFAYKNYSNVHKFYESYKYHRAEKKYNRLYRFDISKCFNSIYSHSISWALLNKDIVKDKIRLSNNTFGGKFDSLMQAANYGETHGIIIGPEFSRIFAELILQKIDSNVLHDLKSKKIDYKVHYEIFRYVDDYFVFYNDERTKEEILNSYRLQLKEYKLYLNETKESMIDKPIITGLTIAKQNISDLMNRNFKFNVSTKEAQDEEEEESEKKYSFYYSSNKLITRFKTIIKEAKVSYKDVLNYTLACVDRKVVELIDKYSEIEDKNKYEQKATKAILAILDFSFFFYSVYPRANTTIKLCLVLSKLIKFAKQKSNFNHEHKHFIYKKIYDDIFLVLRKNKNSEYAQVETLYLLIVLKELGRDYRLDENVLCKYSSINIENKKCNYDLNYFLITVLLFYIENKPRYSTVKEILKGHIKNKFEAIDKFNRTKTTELTLLLFDLCSCPYLDSNYKKEVLSLYDIDDSIKTGILNRQENWFTKWANFNFEKELEAKRSQEVY